jgi:epoxyqueuosine reductase
VVALACNYFYPGDDSLLARYARGRDYHATLRDRLRTLRRTLRARWPDVHDYGSVDANPVMEKVWAVRAGLGTVGKNACLITPQFGSWVVLAVMVLDADVSFDALAPFEVCGKCRLCLDACPTQAFVADRVVDARKCLSYQTIENDGLVPEGLRPALAQTIFGCDVCQDVCPHNTREVLAGPRFAPRQSASLAARALAGLTQAQWDALAPGTPLMRPGYDGVRRNAVYALGATADEGARPLLEQLAGDASERVREAARWALGRLAP